MPTGYTAYVGDGCTFAEFVWRCARAMGANIMMRDDSPDAPVREYEPNLYYLESLNKGKARLQQLATMSSEETAKAAREEYTSIVRQNEENKRAAAELRAKYVAMLARVADWTPPTPEHQGFKDFMASQLQESIRADCVPYLTEPKLKSGEEWQRDAIARCKQDIEYDEKHHAEELKRTAERNAWNKALAESVPPPRLKR